MSYLGNTDQLTTQEAAAKIRDLAAGLPGQTSSGSSSLPITVIAIGGIAAVAAYFLFFRKK